MPHARRLAVICRRSRRRLTLLGAFLVAGAAACEPAAVAAAPSPTTTGTAALHDDVTASFGTVRHRHVVALVRSDSSDELPIQIGVGPTGRGGPRARFRPDAVTLRRSAAVASRTARCRAARPPP